MERVKKLGKVLGIVLVVLLVGAGAVYGWASYETASMLDATYSAHEVDFPIPFPLSEAELDAIRAERLAELAPPEPAAPPEAAPSPEQSDDEEALPEEAPVPAIDPMEGVDLEAIALERAVERGRHLVEARYACIECHGDDFGGGTMMDDPAIGTLLGPNLTGGGRVAEWTPTEWDHAVRHGILPDGRPSAMPADDYKLMSDRELSDVIAYIRSLPPVDTQVAAVSLGPVGTVLMATGQLPLAANTQNPEMNHLERAPESGPTAEFGAHLAGVCTGCHRPNLEGGPMAFGAPDWLPARNLTPHAEGLEGWTQEDFVTAMREMRRPDGTELGVPMTLMQRYIGNMTDTELEALWIYLQSIEPRPTGT